MGKFRILSLDGGGIRGAFTAAFLAEIENQVGKPLAKHFDLIAGTSTGAIIAVALALEVPAEQVRLFYESKGREIFMRRPKAKIPWRNWCWKALLDGPLRPFIDQKLSGNGLDVDYILQSKYDAPSLRRALTSVYGTKTLEHAITRLVIPSVDLSRGQTVVFKTPHLQRAASRDRNYLAVDVVMASAAAPTYFPHACIESGSIYCDGGLWANNPSMVAFAEAVRISRDCKRDGDPCFEPHDISLLSVGTGKVNYTLEPPQRGAGLGWWAGDLFDVTSTSQSQGVAFQAQYVLPEDNYRRVDYTVPDKAWKLDSIELLEKFFHYGREAAHGEGSGLIPRFFDGVAPRFVPFDVGGGS